MCTHNLWKSSETIAVKWVKQDVQLWLCTWGISAEREMLSSKGFVNMYVLSIQTQTTPPQVQWSKTLTPVTNNHHPIINPWVTARIRSQTHALHAMYLHSWMFGYMMTIPIHPPLLAPPGKLLLMLKQPYNIADRTGWSQFLQCSICS